MNCDCSDKFRHRFLGLCHWWKYTKLRYHWREFWNKLHWEQIYYEGELYWFDTGDWPILRRHTKYPGPCMTKDEYDHWFRHS